MSITQPPNPFIGYTNEQFAFVGAATDASGKDVTADCDWVWYFTKGKGVSGNPVLYAFAKAGEVTVTATAHLKGDSGAATITGTISAAPPAAKMVIAPFMYAKLNDGTRVEPNTCFCDMGNVFMELPPSYVWTGFQKKPSNSSTWAYVQGGFYGQSQHDGVTWMVYGTTCWSSFGEKNWGIDWKGTWTKMGMPPQFGYASASWLVFNTIVTSGDGVILFDPDDPALDEATIPWSISHMDHHPTFDVTVSVMTVTGTVVKTLTATAGLGADSITWDGGTNAGPTATKGVYTYQVSAAHRWNDYPDQLCSYCAFRADLVTAGDLHEFELDAPDDEVHYKVSDTLSRAVGSCSAKVYSPQLAECPNTPTPPTTAGAYESGTIIVPAVSGPPHTYTLVVFTTETAADGLLNRDLQPKPGLRKGGGQTYGVVARGWLDYTLVPDWGSVPQDLGEMGYATALDGDWPCASPAQALDGLNTASVVVFAQHGGGPGTFMNNWTTYHAPSLNLYRLGYWSPDGVVFSHDDATAGPPPHPPGYAPGLCLAPADYAGDWQQLLFVLYLSCESGADFGSEGDLLTATTNAGAHAALGFEAPIYLGDGHECPHKWLQWFWESANAGSSVAGAAAYATQQVQAWVASHYQNNPLLWPAAGLDSCRVLDTDTQTGTVLDPAKYGW